MNYEIRYARNDRISLAWCAVGDGDIDLLVVPGMISQLDVQLRHPEFIAFVSRLAAFCRVILMDKRGQGLSDRDAGSTLEERMDDLRAVLDAAGSKRAALCAISEGGPLSMLFAATYPERVRGLVLAGSLLAPSAADEFPGQRRANETLVEIVKRDWGRGRSLELVAPSLQEDAAWREFMGLLERSSGAPGGLFAAMRWIGQLDVRPVAKSLQVPVLVWHRAGDALVMVEQGRWLGRNLPGARYVEEAGDAHLPFFEPDRFVAEVREFLTGSRDEVIEDRILATVMFTDIVGSTELVARHGDRGWSRLLERHRAIVREQLGRHRGQEVDTTGDGFFAVFDGPARAVQCAARVRDAVRGLGLEVRAGVHTGECQRTGGGYGGIAVHTAARVMSLARPGEVLVSRTVRDLVAGSGLSFEGRGTHELKGVPGPWELFAAQPGGTVS
jgi:class 3 adenylate cyclase